MKKNPKKLLLNRENIFVISAITQTVSFLGLMSPNLRGIWPTVQLGKLR